MSQLETNPLNTPTQLVVNPNQVMAVNPTANVTNFQWEDQLMIRYNKAQQQIQQLDWVKLANKNKFFDSFTWTIGATGNIWTKEITPRELLKLIPVGKNNNSFVDFNAVLFSLKNANNPFYAGYAVLYFDPAPTPDYYQNMIQGFTKTLANIWQFQTVPLSPKTADEVNFTIPLIYPFEKMRTHRFGSTEPYPITDYLLDYPLGRLAVDVFSPLASTSPIVDLEYTLSAQILDLEITGSYFNNAE